MPRLLHLTSSLGPTSHARQLSLLVPALRELGYESRIINLGATAPFADTLRGFPVHSVHMRSWFDPRAWMEVRNLIQGEPWDALCSWGECSTLCTYFLKQARLLGKSARRWIAIPDMRAESAIRKSAERWAVRSADRVIVNPCWAHDATTHDLITSTRCHTLPLAVARPVVHKSRAEILREIGLPPGARFVIAAGNFDRDSHLVAAVWAFDVMRYPFQDLHLVMVGEGPERPKIERLSRSLAPEDHRVHYLGLRPDLAEWMTYAEQVWVTHLRGGCNLVCEAHAAGKPLISFENADLDLLLPGFSRARRGDIAQFATLARTQMDSQKQAIDFSSQIPSARQVANMFAQIAS